VNVEPLATIEADATQMHQLMQNLISNALKFHKEGQPPLVSIRSKILEGPGAPGNGSSADQRTCQIEISDNGIGFDDKYLDRIFLPFERLHGHSEYQGTGMGLAICRKIVERHGGSISAQSSPNQGATFIVRLPVRNRQGVEEHEPKTDHHPAG
jgi:signal transduction histidine kinase